MDGRGLVGAVVDDRYRIERLLGEGGMGAVYEAVHLALDSVVALKVLNSLSASDAQRQRFLQEARAAAQIRHENVVYISDFGERPLTYFVMEHLRGHDLSQILKTNVRLCWARAKPLLLQTMRALAAAHERHIVHRDIKPSNIFVVQREDGSELVKVLDFGIAKVAATGVPGLTGTGQIVGTSGYMAPEQVLNAPIDGRTDVYSMGVVMYEVLTGRLPFTGANTFELLRDHLQTPAPSLPCAELELPHALEAIVARALAKAPGDRFPTMDALRLAIEPIVDDAPVLPRTGPVPAVHDVQAVPPPAPPMTRTSLTPTPSASNLTIVAPTRERPPQRRMSVGGVVGTTVLLALVGAMGVVGLKARSTPEVAVTSPPPLPVENDPVRPDGVAAPPPEISTGARDAEVPPPPVIATKTETVVAPNPREDETAKNGKPKASKASATARTPPRSTDKAVLTAFVRRAKASCAPVDPTHVVLQVLPSGAVPMANTTPKNACIEGLAKTTTFTPRDSPSRFERDIP